MSSSSHNNIEDTKSHDTEKKSKPDDATFVGPKPCPQPESQHGVRDEGVKAPESKVDQALRFLLSVFESGDSSTNIKGVESKLFAKVNYKFVFLLIMCFSISFLCHR